MRQCGSSGHGVSAADKWADYWLTLSDDEYLSEAPNELPIVQTPMLSGFHYNCKLWRGTCRFRGRALWAVLINPQPPEGCSVLAFVTEIMHLKAPKSTCAYIKSTSSCALSTAFLTIVRKSFGSIYSRRRRR